MAKSADIITSLGGLSDASTTATSNLGLGTGAVDAITTGDYNVGVGDSALTNATSGARNTAIGWQALTTNTTGNYNTASGMYALQSNTTGASNTASGYQALFSNTTAQYNTASGYRALYSNTTGGTNTANGYQALYANTSGYQNIGVGYLALDSNTSGYQNIGVGSTSLPTMTTGYRNVGVGALSLRYTTTGAYNTALGYSAGANITTGSSNIIIGSNASAASATADSQLNIGGWIKGAAGEIHIPGASGVGIAPTAAKLEVFTSADTETVGQFKNGTGSATATIVKIISARADVVHALQCFKAGTTETFRIAATGNVLNLNNSYGALSDIKLKENVVDATPKLADIMKVKVRNYNLIGDTTKQLGVIAQELETVFPSMVDESIDRTEDGEMLDTTTKSVKYSVFVPVLLKSLQEAVAKIEALEARITLLETP
jgi:hypothetical protein